MKQKTAAVQQVPQQILTDNIRELFSMFYGVIDTILEYVGEPVDK